MRRGRTTVRMVGWALGMPLASLRYLLRRSNVDRREVPHPRGSLQVPDVPEGVQHVGLGVGPLFHRTYRVRIAGAKLSAESLIAVVGSDPNVASPTEVAVFEKTRGAPGELAVGDEFRIRMPGPWDGPVRVVDVDERSFRLATLDGHIEAGTIRFTADAGSAGGLVDAFEIESWARSGNAWQHVLYSRVGIAKAIQGSMWEAFLERVTLVAGGRRLGQIEELVEREAG